MFWKVDTTDIVDARYDERVVCFLDILGFREFIKKDKGQKSLNSVRDLLLNIRPGTLCQEEPVGEDISQNLAEKYGALVVQFSDCIFISMKEVSYDSLDWLYSLILNVTSNMIESGMMCRGAITIGDIYHKSKNRSLLFGPAVIDAYEMESKCAIFPRVIVAKVLEQRQSNLRSRSNRTKDRRSLSAKYLSRDSDDFLYVDYFQKLYDFKRFPKLTRRHLQHVREHIVTQLEKVESQSVEQKMNWAKRKYNNYLKKKIIKYIDAPDNTDDTMLKMVKKELYKLESI